MTVRVDGKERLNPARAFLDYILQLLRSSEARFNEPNSVFQVVQSILTKLAYLINTF